MAEEGSVYDLKGLEIHLHTLFGRFTCNDLKADSGPFSTDFCKLVEEYASHWQVPLSQLRILEIALCYFARAAAIFTENCDHVHRTLSSLSLSVFELLLFFDQRDFEQDFLKQFTITFQECCSALTKHQNVHLMQVERLLSAGGPWASQTLQAILSESTLPQTEVEGCISSEPPVFYELRVRYLLSCQRLPEALALAKCCAQHPTVGQHLFFLQVYLTGLYKTSQHECLHKEVADFSAKEAVHIICALESEEEDELLLGLGRAFLSQQLRKGDMHFLCDLVLIWSKLHSRLKTPKEALLKECQQLMLSATNVNTIFPFIRVLTQELNEDGVQFCVDLCANALRSCLPGDVVTKSLIYKTIAGLLPNDLEICRACALLVFFLERSVEAYKMVYILYMHPDQEYQIDSCPIGNNVRFETLQVLKKDMRFDPEFWNLMALRTNCLKLMNEIVLSAALEEIVEEKWVPSHCLKAANPSSSRSICTKENGVKKAKRRHKGDQQNHRGNREETGKASKRLKVVSPQINNHQPLKKKRNQGSRQWKKVPQEPLRRSSFWQLDRIHSNRAMEYRENKRTTRLSDKIPHKRTIRKPKWLLEDSGTLEMNAPLKARRQHQRFYYTTIVRRNGAVKNNTKDKVNSRVKLEDNAKKLQKELPLDSHTAPPGPQIILELSLPDNELMGTFADEPCKRHRGFPQKLFYKPTVKVPSTVPPEKPPHQKEVILKAQDTATFMQMLHCYTRRTKGKKIWTNSQGSASTITRSSGQMSAAKEEPMCDKPAVEMKVTISSQSDKVTTKALRSSRQEIKDKAVVTRDAEKNQEATMIQSDSVAKVMAEPTVEMKVTVASRKHRHSPRLEKTPNAEHILKTVSKKSTEKKKAEISATTLLISSEAIESSKSQDSVVTNRVNGTPNQAQKSSSPEDENSKVSNDKARVKDGVPEEKSINTVMVNMDSQPVLEGEIKTDVTPYVDNQKDPATDSSDPIESNTEDNPSQQIQPLPSCASPPARSWEDDGFDETESLPECEESKLEFCCVLCHRDIKGSRVVVHAMFHYRKDQCMFCGLAFKNDLKAMIHISNHLEKLKKQQNGNKIQEKSKTKDKPKTPVKTKTISNEKRCPGRLKKSHSRLRQMESRKLRSSDKKRDGITQSEQSNVKHLRSKCYVQKVNGHIGKREKSDGIKESLITKTKLRQRTNEKINEPTATVTPAKKETEKPLVVVKEQETQKEITCKTIGPSVADKNVTSEDKLCCPVDGCSWFSHKNRIAFLCHAMEEHKSDMRPLELSFRTANNMCSICKRVLYSFEHFLHHIERHRAVPRHPCLHKGCTARFNSIKEMRRHARKHSPLQAVCCLPECPKLFICLWALILHEKDHYSKGATTVHKDNKQTSTQVIKQEHDTASKKTQRQTPLVNEKDAKASNETKDLNSSKKNLSAQPAATRLLRKLRKMHVIKANMTQRHKLIAKTRTRKGLPRLRGMPAGKTVLPENPKQVSNQEVKSHKGRAQINLDKAKTRGMPHQKNERVADAKVTSKNLTPSKKPNPEKTKSPKNVAEIAAPVVDSPVIEANANMETTYSIAPVIVSDSPTEKVRNVEEENALMEVSLNSSDNCETVKAHVDYEIEQVEVNQETNIIDSTTNSNGPVVGNTSEVETSEHVAASVKDSSELDNNSKMGHVDSSVVPQSPPAIPTVTPETPAVEEASKMAVVDPSPNVEVQNSNMENTDHTYDSCPPAVATQVQIPEHTAEPEDNSADGMSKMGTKEPAANRNVEDIEAPIEEKSAGDNSKIQTVASSASDTNGSVAITSKVETVGHKEPENLAIKKNPIMETTDSILIDTNDSPLVNMSTHADGASGKAGLAAGKENDKKLSVFKTLAKLKTFMEKRTMKRGHNEPVGNTPSKKSKSEMQNEDKAASVITYSAIEGKQETETTNSTEDASNISAPVVMSDVSDVNETSTDELAAVKETKLAIKRETHTRKEKGHKSKMQGKVIMSNNVNETSKDQGLAIKRKTHTGKKSAKPSKCISKANTEEKSRKKCDQKRVIQRTKELSESKMGKSKDPNIETATKNLVCSGSQVDYVLGNITMAAPVASSACSSEVKESHQASTVQDTNEVQTEKEDNDESCLKKKQRVYDRVPEEEESPLVAFEKALTEYKKRPYMRLPATAYLEEKFTTMPKRRKDMSTFFGSSQKTPKVPQQKQRCAKCFATFSSEEDLQHHLQYECSNMFGFESDEEGTS